MSKKIKITIAIILIILVCIVCFIFFSNNKDEIISIKSEKELLKIYEGKETTSDAEKIAVNIFSMPFSFLSNISYRKYSLNYDYRNTKNITSGIDDYVEESFILDDSATTNSNTKISSKDYSTTNIQVENVDEADITKTDGDYIYSISDNKVIITNVKDLNNIKIESTIAISSTAIPEDLIIYNNKLVVIASNSSTTYYRNNSDTIVRIYDISVKDKPNLIKSYELNQPYYTSRCINNELYVIASGRLKKDGDKVDRKYTENNDQKEINLEDIKYIKDVDTKNQTLFSVVNLNNINEDIKVSSYLIDISNCYVSEKNIYLLNQKYEYGYDSNIPPIYKLFGPGGIIGYFASIDDYYYNDISNRGYFTEIYKFNISNDGNIKYDKKTKTEGKTINQYSLDEKDNHLRVALYDNNGARIVVFNENMNKIGSTPNVAKGENMYSSRFMGDKAYLVTYRNMDPLFVIDLKDDTNPKVLGELHIPGYSTYLHPYDENHLIGIGMETEEVVNRNSSGKVTSTSAKIIGMKMALFDVSDVNNPIQISQTIIGDRRTTSAILTNPKALLFSKSKELIAIPVNNYSEDFEVESYEDTYSSVIDSYKRYNKNYIAEGYFVYNINLTDGFKLKGVITHEADNKNKNNYYYYRNSKLLRGLYIDNNLYTVSETAVKVNKLDTLEQISELKIK